ncbi:MAG: MliC family protein [Alphaproteobacteria bacterium]|nr:MliC family protein [Alphaproteobacteria bacterium]MBN2675526.1 MliC family protein [Alphaproteobacteria bacterium]
MKKLLFCLFAATALTACSESDKLMKCGDYEISKKLEADMLAVVINGDAVVLKQTVSASGARYEGVLNDTNVTLWNKGKHWTLFLNDESIECE